MLHRRQELMPIFYGRHAIGSVQHARHTASVCVWQ
jgi:hypothetical protein